MSFRRQIQLSVQHQHLFAHCYLKSNLVKQHSIRLV